MAAVRDGEERGRRWGSPAATATSFPLLVAICRSDPPGGENAARDR